MQSMETARRASKVAVGDFVVNRGAKNYHTGHLAKAPMLHFGRVVSVRWESCWFRRGDSHWVVEVKWNTPDGHGWLELLWSDNGLEVIH